jgi:hypothetical protein
VRVCARVRDCARCLLVSIHAFSTMARSSSSSASQQSRRCALSPYCIPAGVIAGRPRNMQPTSARPFVLQIVLQTQASIAVRRGGGPFPLGATSSSLPSATPRGPLTPSHESEQTPEHEVSPAAAEVVESPSPTKRPSPGPSVFLITQQPLPCPSVRRRERARAFVGTHISAHMRWLRTPYRVCGAFSRMRAAYLYVHTSTHTTTPFSRPFRLPAHSSIPPSPQQLSTEEVSQSLARINVRSPAGVGARPIFNRR